MFACSFCHKVSLLCSSNFSYVKICVVQYENMPMLYTAFFHGCKKDNLHMKKCDVFFFAQNIDCGYTLEPPQ